MKVILHEHYGASFFLFCFFFPWNCSAMEQPAPLNLEGSQNELLQIGRAPLPEAVAGSKAWQALALRRDIQALLKAQPPHGLSNLPAATQAHKEFSKLLNHTLHKLDQRAGEIAAKLPANKLYGPWEGGIGVSEVGNALPQATPYDLKLFCWNIRGALSSATGHEAHSARISQVVQALHRVGATIAILSEPRFGPGLLWPQWTGYALHGARSYNNDSVSILVLQDLEDLIVPIPDLGDKRAVWLEIRTPRGAAPGILVLGIYAPPPNYSVAERSDFFKERMREVRQVASCDTYQGWPIVVAGDFNIHDARLTEKDRNLARPVDRDILHLLETAFAEGRRLVLLNPPGQPTHASGSTLDLVFASTDITPYLQLISRADLTPKSDHDAILLGGIGRASTTSKLNIGVSRWNPCVDDWYAALLRFEHSLSFVGSFVLHLLFDTFLRDSVVTSQWRKLRQALVDLVVWWKTVIVVLAGHIGGLAVTSKPMGSSRVLSPKDVATNFVTSWFREAFPANSLHFEEIITEVVGTEDLAKIQGF